MIQNSEHPKRQCVACRQRFARATMLRLLAVRAEGARVLSASETHVQLLRPGESSGRWQGRSAYLCHTTSCLAIALKRKSLNRALKCALPGDILERIANNI